MKPLHSVYTKILLIILLGFALPLSLILFYGYSSLESTIRRKIEQQANTNFDNLRESIQSTINQISQTSTYISTDVRLNQLLTSYNDNIPEGQNFSYSCRVPEYMSRYNFMQISSEIRMHLSNYAANWLPQGSEMSLLLSDGQFFCTWSNYNTNFDVLTDILGRSDAGIYFSGTHSSLCHYNSNEQQFSLVKNIYSIYDTRSLIGTLIITIPISALEKALKNYQNEDFFSFHVLNPQKEVVTQVLGKDSFSEESMQLIEAYDSLYHRSYQSATLDKVFIRCFSVEGPSWNVYLLVPHNDIFRELLTLRQTILAAIAILAVLLTCITLFLLYRIFAPLRKLTVSMYKVEKDIWNITALPVKTKDEIGALTEGFNHLIAQLHQMFEKIKESERQKGQLKFEMLLAQINPHFLFNTLNSIRWMAMMIHADNIVDTIRSLARLLEISMNRQTDVISIKDEVENLKSYLDIQSLRYSGLFSVSFAIDPRLENLECLKLVFQPFVENAIFYNIQEEKPLHIQIAGALEEPDTEESVVVLKIIDNGKGMSQEQIARVLSNDITHDRSVFRGIGINNVRQRIQYKYGERYGIFMDSTLGDGLQITIRFPARPFVSQKEEGAVVK